MHVSKTGLLRFSECALWAAGLLLGGAGIEHIVRYERFQHRAAILPAQIALGGNENGSARALRIAGRLEAPRIGLSVLVVDGDENAGLALAAVHLADTPEIGAGGNAVVAGHRDMAFWPLRRIRIGDRIRYAATKVRTTFIVDSIRIVKPNNMSVLQPTGSSSLTLITCYPFRFVGSAPLRFVVRAHRQFQPRAA